MRASVVRGLSGPVVAVDRLPGFLNESNLHLILWDRLTQALLNSAGVYGRGDDPGAGAQVSHRRVQQTGFTLRLGNAIGQRGRGGVK